MDRYKIGDKAEMNVLVDEDFVADFARFSGDQNPLHLDPAFAETTRFKRRVAHGMSYGAVFSRLVGMELPGPGALWTSQSFRFIKPVYIGDRLQLSVEVAAVNESTRSLSLQCKAVNQTGETVMTGNGEVMLLEAGTLHVPVKAPGRRVAIVTGGSRGIGAAIARRLGTEGFAVAITYRSSRREAEALVNDLNGAISIHSDAGEPTEAHDVVKQVTRLIGTPDTLILNASGSDFYGGAADGDFSAFARHLRVQLEGAHALVSSCIDSMMERQFGSIIAVGSTYVDGPPPSGMAPYVVGKTALVAYIRCLAVEYGKNGIRANVVAPSMTETSLLSSVPDRARKVTAIQNPMRRLATPEDIAGAVSFLSSDHASYVNGHTLVVSGGSHMP